MVFEPGLKQMLFCVLQCSAALDLDVEIVISLCPAFPHWFERFASL